MLRLLLCTFVSLGFSFGAIVHDISDIENVFKHDGGKHWALIIAGSNTWMNYRHQADACHAYQIVRKHGIPEENIVLMMYDDLAQNMENPTPGVIINHIDGDDVYKGVNIDYKREDVTPENFLAVLRGDKQRMRHIGSGRVVASGPNDHVFVNFVDHGGPGILGFPMGVLHAQPLVDTLKEMHSDKKFKQLVFYVEACESGSIFDGLLPDDVNIWVTTAANPNESSYACYFDERRKTYLGDWYSVNWMEDSDKENLSKETLHKQFRIVKSETNKSHVQEYGDKSIAQETVSLFQGGKKYKAPEPRIYPKRPIDAVRSEDVPMAILRRKLAAVSTAKEERDVIAQIQALQQERDSINWLMRRIVSESLFGSSIDHDAITSTRTPLTQHQCYQTVVNHLHDTCFRFSNNGYAMRQLYHLVNLCEASVDVNTIVSGIDSACENFEL